MGLIIIVVVLILMLYFIPFGYYYFSKKSGLKISFGYMIGLRIRKVPIKNIMDAMIEAKIAKITNVTIQDFEALSLAGGDPSIVMKAIVNAKSKGIDLTFKEASGEQLNGIDLIEKYK